MKKAYERLDKRLTELSWEVPGLSRDQETLRFMEGDSIMHFLGAGGIENYEQVVAFCQERNIHRVFDIGAAYGHQSECFLDTDIEYVGVDDAALDRWNSDKYQYIQGVYPCPLPVETDDLAVSVLCLTWRCYLQEGEKTLHQQCEALAKDFSHALLYVMDSAIDTLKNYFSSVEKLPGGFVYCTNN